MVTRNARRWFGWAIGVILVLAIIALLVGWFIHSGIYNVAATYSDSAPVAWVMSTTMDNSVKQHAKGIKVPALNDPAMIQTGAGHYQEMCVMCHGAPGVPIGEVGRGLQPRPPELNEAAGDWKPNELFWITKNGVRMAGMPAWGVTYPDNVIWALVAFTRELPSMTLARYKTLSREAPHLQKEP